MLVNGAHGDFFTGRCSAFDECGGISAHDHPIDVGPIIRESCVLRRHVCTPRLVGRLFSCSRVPIADAEEIVLTSTIFSSFRTCSSDYGIACDTFTAIIPKSKLYAKVRPSPSV